MFLCRRRYRLCLTNRVFQAAIAQVQPPNKCPASCIEKRTKLTEHLIVDHRPRFSLRRRERSPSCGIRGIVRSVSTNAYDPTRSQCPDELDVHRILRAEQAWTRYRRNLISEAHEVWGNEGKSLRRIERNTHLSFTRRSPQCGARTRLDYRSRGQAHRSRQKC